MTDCSKNGGVGTSLVSCLQLNVPGLQPDDVIRLNHGDTTEDVSLSLALLTAITSNNIWREREVGTNVKDYKVRAELEQYITLLRTTRLVTSTNRLCAMMSLMFQ